MAKHKSQPKQGIKREAVQVSAPSKATEPHKTGTPFSIDEKWIPAILSVMVFVSYIPVWQNNFVWDDKPYITINELVKSFDIKGIFSEYVVGNYHPLTVLSLAIEYALVKEQTWLYHLDNLILHTLNSWLVFRLIQKLNSNVLVSFVTAVLFAIHPLHVESVAWAAERKDVLYTLFLLLSFWYYIHFDETSNKVYYGVSILLFIASCMSKGMAVVLPAILIITDYCFLKKPLHFKVLINKIPYFLVTLIFAYLATHAQKDAGADASSVISNAYSAGERVLLTAYAFCFYWVKTLLPYNLYPFYPYPNKISGSIPAIYSLALLGTLLLVGVLIWLGRKDKRIWWAGAFFLIAISTVLQILPVGSALVADRYYYLSSIGPLFLIGLLMNNFYANAKGILAGFMVVALVLCGMTFVQAKKWKNELLLFKEADKAFPNDAMILSNLGWYYLDNKDFPTAKQYLMRADNGGFKNADVCRTIGSMFLDEGDNATALKYFQKASQYLPKSNRTNWLFATVYYRMGDYKNANYYYKITLENEPDNAEYWTSYGLSLMGSEDFEEARKIFQKSISLKPDYWDAYLNHAFSYRRQGNYEQEIKELKALIEKAPQYGPAYKNLGVTYVDLKQDDNAVEYWRKATVRDSTGDFEYNIGINYANRNDVETAKQWYIKSAKKGNVNARNILKNNGITNY
ncbi:tetratricopeptide repeat protein [Emticicia sp. BO119]|uniref:tetratricopeptide repeat protein n=1 Tax=Emticicia sp. BO119 TaxID=2757768 RepID=UPI0015F01FDD|nr:tetratricopeptide repeat protein [Emticicia sp. BO119]MBA4853717.1 tetratricopeptide repeat protein [Emticicia sp. BO119]